MKDIANVGKIKQIAIVNDIIQKERKMKISKIILVSILGAVVLNCAIADEYDGPRNRCKSKSNKIWVENTKTCIPENPCKESGYEKYCNRDFKEYQSPKGSNMYVHLINLYADSHNLKCSAVPKDADLVGQDFVLCKGNDVMVFEFDDISNSTFLETVYSADWNTKQLEATIKAVCKAINGTIKKEGLKTVCSTSNPGCPRNLNKALSDYVSASTYSGQSYQKLEVNKEDDVCSVVADFSEIRDWEQRTSEARASM